MTRWNHVLRNFHDHLKRKGIQNYMARFLSKNCSEMNEIHTPITVNICKIVKVLKYKELPWDFLRLLEGSGDVRKQNPSRLDTQQQVWPFFKITFSWNSHQCSPESGWLVHKDAINKVFFVAGFNIFVFWRNISSKHRISFPFYSYTFSSLAGSNCAWPPIISQNARKHPESFGRVQNLFK